MKTEQLRAMTDAELNKKLSDLKAELFNLRFSHATGSLTNPLQLNTCKKNIAQVKTVIRERELGIIKTDAPKKEEKVEAKKTVKTTTNSETKKSTSTKKTEKKA